MKDKAVNITKYVLFPLIIVVFALLKVNKGINLEDTTYSLGNYRFFTESTGVWFLLTFVSNVAGYLLMLLPGGATMLGMNIYASLLVALMGVLSYRFFITKMPYYLAFIAEIVAVSMCWAPKTILYHYLTYFVLMMGAILLFRGLAGNSPVCLFLAGVILGINLLVRFPNNGLEVLLIIPLIYYGAICKISTKEMLKSVVLCVSGYLLGFILILAIMSAVYGMDTFGQLINGVLGISGSASDYTMGAMIISILDAYWHGFKWALYLIVCALMGIPFFLLFDGKWMKLRKIVYCVCIVLLYFVLYKWGMFNFKYYQKESALQLGAIFLLMSIGVNLWMLFTKQINNDWKLIGAISLVIILITPLGSNNYIWPVLNNLFLIAPVTIWMIYRFTKWGREYLDYSRKVPLFAIKAMLFSVLLMFAVQAIGVGVNYVFVDGEDGQRVSYEVTNSQILKGMKTTEVKASALSELCKYMNEHDELDGRSVILYGNIPGLSYILDRPSALNTTWSDLASNPVEDMKESIENVDTTNPDKRPIVIISRALYDVPDNSIKFDLVNSLIYDNGYEEAYINDLVVVYR